MCVCMQVEVCSSEMEGRDWQEREGETAGCRPAASLHSEMTILALLERGVVYHVCLDVTCFVYRDGRGLSPLCLYI